MPEIPDRPKTLKEAKEYLLERVLTQRNPMEGAREEDVRAALDRLTSLDPDHWVSVWSEAAAPHEEEAHQQEARGNDEAARRSYLLAYQYYRLGRFPCPNTPAKEASARASRANYRAASRYFDPPMEIISISFEGRPGEGDAVPVYLRKPNGVERPPVVIQYSGIDSYKEERHPFSGPFLDRGVASLVMDMPGAGESPIKGSPDAERLFPGVISYLQGRADLDGSRIGMIGGSFGGHWATKVAYNEHERLTAVVQWGGAVHHGFQPDWVLKSRFAPSYLGDLLETRAHAFGLATGEDWMEFAPSLSLLDQGLLDGTHCPMLLVNGKDDTQVPIEDLYLLLEHGGPKEARVFPGGHMGYTPQTFPTIVEWMTARLLDDGAVRLGTKHPRAF